MFLIHIKKRKITAVQMSFENMTGRITIKTDIKWQR